MYALTGNAVDLLLAAVIVIPCLVAAMAYVAVWFEDRGACPCEKCQDERAVR